MSGSVNSVSHAVFTPNFKPEAFSSNQNTKIGLPIVEQPKREKSRGNKQKLVILSQ